MRTLLNFLLKYDYWLLFILLEVVSFVLLFRFNNYQGSVLFTSANSVVGSLYATVSNVTSYFGLHDANRKLTYRNAELELQVEQLKKALYQSSWDSVSVAKILHMVDNYALISPNLFREQKLSTKYYVFRHHLETTVEDKKELQEFTWKRFQTFKGLDEIVKVRVNHIGQIVSVGEY